MPPSQPSIAELIGRISVRLRQSMADNMDKADLGGMTPQQSRVLGYIEANQHKDGGLIQRDIAEITGTRSASVSAMLGALESDGWIERGPDPADSRRKTLHATPKGTAMVKNFELSLWAGIDDRIGGLTEAETRTLADLLIKVDRHLAG